MHSLITYIQNFYSFSALKVYTVYTISIILYFGAVYDASFWKAVTAGKP